MSIEIENLVTLLIRKKVFTEEELREITVELREQRRRDREDERGY